VIGAKDPQRLSALRETLPRVADVGGTVMLLWIRPELGRVGPWRRYRQAQARADDLLYQEIAEHRADPDLDQRTDVLSLLMHQEQSDPAGPDDRNLRDQLVTLLLAGHETTTTALAWAFERLLRHPDVLSRLSESIAAGEDEYLDAVVKEILRLRPVIHDVGRVLTVPAEIAGHRLPAGTVVSPSIGLVQSADANFPDADAFAPERFLDAQAPPYSWIPFGGGSRRCLGAAFATLEMKTVLRTILSRTQLQPVGAPHTPHPESWRRGPPAKPNTLSGTPRQRYRPRRRKPSTRNSNQKDRSQRWVRDQQPLTVTHRPSHSPIPGYDRQPQRTSNA
jgi:cytochrome P450 family 135